MNLHREGLDMKLKLEWIPFDARPFIDEEVGNVVGEATIVHDGGERPPYTLFLTAFGTPAEKAELAKAVVNGLYGAFFNQLADLKQFRAQQAKQALATPKKPKLQLC